MSVFLLPTRGTIKYCGKYPNRIRSMSGGPSSFDRTGTRCLHIETNNGDRYTVTYAALAFMPANASFVGQDFGTILKDGVTIEPMTQRQYDDWLDRIEQVRKASQG